MTTLFKHKKTGARVKIISELDNGDCFMVEDQDSRTFYAYKHELETDPEGTKKVKTLQIKDKAAKEEPRDFPPETRLNIKVELYNMMGKIIRLDDSRRIDLSNYPDGIYNLIIKYDKIVINKKVIKIK